MDSRTLTPEEITVIARLCWGSRMNAGTEELAGFLGINHRNANKLLSGELRANPGVSRELLDEFRQQHLRSSAPWAKLIREALEPETSNAG